MIRSQTESTSVRSRSGTAVPASDPSAAGAVSVTGGGTAVVAISYWMAWPGCLSYSIRPSVSRADQMQCAKVASRVPAPEGMTTTASPAYGFLHAVAPAGGRRNGVGGTIADPIPGRLLQVCGDLGGLDR